MKYRAALFDFDGTLADSNAWCLTAMNELAGVFGYKPIQPGEHDFVRGLNTQQLLKHMGLPMWKLPALSLRMRKLAARDIHKIQLFAGIPGMLGELHQMGVKISIVTSNSQENVTQVMGENLRFIKWLSCGASLLGKAPKLKSAARKFGLLAHECIYIGDEIRDATAASGAGMNFGAVSWGYSHLAALKEQNPAMVFNSVGEVAGLFGKTS